MYLDVGFFYGRFLLIISFFDGAPGGFKRRSEGRADVGGGARVARLGEMMHGFARGIRRRPRASRQALMTLLQDSRRLVLSEIAASLVLLPLR